MQKIKIVFLLSVSQLIGLLLLAQDDTAKTTFGETMRSNGRIYVVVAVMLTILTGLILYLVRLDRKISKIEKEH
jgi:hypothetical protein